MFGDQWTTSGGRKLPFHSSTRIRLKNMGQIKDTKKNTLGMKKEKPNNKEQIRASKT